MWKIKYEQTKINNNKNTLGLRLNNKNNREKSKQNTERSLEKYYSHYLNRICNKN